MNDQEAGCNETLWTDPEQDLVLHYMQHLLDVLTKYPLLLVLGTEC